MAASVTAATSARKQPLPGHAAVDTVEAYLLEAPAFALDDRDGAARQVQRAGEKLDELVIGRAVDGRGAQPDDHGSIADAVNRRTARARNDAHGEKLRGGRHGPIMRPAATVTYDPLMTRRLMLVLTLLVAAVPALAQAPAREIVNVRGDLYFVRGGSHNTVFLVTPEGIFLGDPVSTEIATWLKGELDTRFPKRQVRHIVYSHHDFDHAEGAAVFPGATIWAHERVVANLDGRLRRLAGGYKDTNGNGQIERAEAGGGYLAAFDRLDRNKDGVVTAPEMNQEIVKPTRTYRDRQTITFGGKTVQLIHPGRNHSDDMTVVYFPAERAAFGVDFVYPGSTPGAWGDYDGTPLSEWVASLRAVEALDIDTFLPGHGRQGTKAEVTENRQFLEDVAAAVQLAILEGRTLDEMKKSITLPAYAKWGNFATGRPANIESAYNNLRRWPDQFRKELTVTVLGAVQKPSVFKVAPGTTVRQVLKMAGGLDAAANDKDIRIMRIVNDNRREYTPSLDDQFLHNDTIIVPRK